MPGAAGPVSRLQAEPGPETRLDHLGAEVESTEQVNAVTDEMKSAGRTTTPGAPALPLVLERPCPLGKAAGCTRSPLSATQPPPPERDDAGGHPTVLPGTAYQLTLHDESTRYVLVAYPPGATP